MTSQIFPGCRNTLYIHFAEYWILVPETVCNWMLSRRIQRDALPGQINMNSLLKKKTTLMFYWNDFTFDYDTFAEALFGYDLYCCSIYFHSVMYQFLMEFVLLRSSLVDIKRKKYPQKHLRDHGLVSRDLAILSDLVKVVRDGTISCNIVNHSTRRHNLFNVAFLNNGDDPVS